MLQNLTPSLLRERVFIQLKLCLFSISEYQDLKASSRTSKKNIHRNLGAVGKKGFKLSLLQFSLSVK